MYDGKIGRTARILHSIDFILATCQSVNNGWGTDKSLKKEVTQVSKQGCSHLYTCLHKLKIHPDICPESYWVSNCAISSRLLLYLAPIRSDAVFPL